MSESVRAQTRAATPRPRGGEFLHRRAPAAGEGEGGRPARRAPDSRAPHPRFFSARFEKKKSHALSSVSSSLSHLEHEPVLARVDGPDQHRVQDLVILLGLGGADVDELPLEVCGGRRERNEESAGVMRLLLGPRTRRACLVPGPPRTGCAPSGTSARAGATGVPKPRTRRLSSSLQYPLSLFALTVLERVQALVRDLDLNRRVEGGRVVEDPDRGDVDGGHGERRRTCPRSNSGE